MCTSNVPNTFRFSGSPCSIPNDPNSPASGKASGWKGESKRHQWTRKQAAADDAADAAVCMAAFYPTSN